MHAAGWQQHRHRDSTTGAYIRIRSVAASPAERRAWTRCEADRCAYGHDIMPMPLRIKNFNKECGWHTSTLRYRCLLTHAGAAAIILTHLDSVEPLSDGAHRDDGAGTDMHCAYCVAFSTATTESVRRWLSHGRVRYLPRIVMVVLSNLAAHAQMVVLWKLRRTLPSTTWHDRSRRQMQPSSGAIV